MSINQKSRNSELRFSTKSIFRFWLVGLLFVLLGFWFYQSLDTIYLIFSALIIAISAEGIIFSLEKRIKSRGLGIAIAYLLLLLFVFSGVLFVIPFALSQLSSLLTRSSSLIGELKRFVLSSTRPYAINDIYWLPEIAKTYFIEHWGEFNWSNAEIQSTLLAGVNAMLDASTTSLKQLSSGIFAAIGGTLSVAINITVVFTLAIFFSMEKEYVINLFVKFSKKEQKVKVREKIDYIYHKLSLWLKARFILSAFVLTAIYLSLWIMQLIGFEIPSMFTLALIAGLLDVIPYIGPIFVIIPIVILVWIHNGFGGMLIVAGVYMLIQWIQNNIVAPVLMERELGVNPVLLLVSALIGAVIM